MVTLPSHMSAGEAPDKQQRLLLAVFNTFLLRF